MTHKELLLHALQRKAPVKGTRVPHFELAFFPTMEAFGEVHPRHRAYSQWHQMKPSERELHRNNIAGLAIKIAEKFDHSAIMVPVITSIYDVEENVRMMELIRKKSKDEYALCLGGYDGTVAIPDGDSMVDFSFKLIEQTIKINISQ